jgi:hypothetical protein
MDLPALAEPQPMIEFAPVVPHFVNARPASRPVMKSLTERFNRNYVKSYFFRYDALSDGRVGLGGAGRP